MSSNSDLHLTSVIAVLYATSLISSGLMMPYGGIDQG